MPSRRLRASLLVSGAAGALLTLMVAVPVLAARGVLSAAASFVADAIQHLATRALALVTMLNWVTVISVVSGVATVVGTLATLGVIRRKVGGREQPTVPAQLPAPLPSFIGRGAPLSDLTKQLSAKRGSDVGVVVISGPPGVGKSQLALRLAHAVKLDYPDGQLYADLRGDKPRAARTLEPGALLARFIRDLGGQPPPTPGEVDLLDASIRTFTSLISGKRLLILLDNGGDQEQIGPLLPAAPGCAVIVTSRSSFTVLGQPPLVLQELAEDEAVAVLLDGLSPSPLQGLPDHTAAKQIAHACAYLPLALALVNGRLKTHKHSLRTTADALDRKRVLDLNESNRSVRAAFEVTFGDLGAEEAEDFCLLSAADLTELSPWSAGALIGKPLAVTRTELDQLVLRNLLIELGEDSRGDMRYKIHDLLRAFAAERLERDRPVEARVALERVLAVYQDYVDHAYKRMTSGYPTRARSRNAWGAEHERERERVLVEAPTWYLREHANIVALIRQAHSARLPLLASLLTSSSFYFWELNGRYEEWRELAGLALTAARDVGDLEAEAIALQRLGKLELNVAQEARTWSLRPTGRAVQGQEPPGQQLPAGGRPDPGRSSSAAIAYLEQAIAMFCQLQRPLEQVLARRDLADAYRSAGRPREAITEYQRVLREIEVCGGRPDLLDPDTLQVVKASVFVSFAQAHLEVGELGPAEDLLCHGLELAGSGSVNHPRVRAFAHRRLGDLYLTAGKTSDAIVQHGLAIELFQAMGDKTWEARTHFELAKAQRAHGLRDKARQQLEAAERLLEAMGSEEVAVVREAKRDARFR